MNWQKMTEVQTRLKIDRRMMTTPTKKTQQLMTRAVDRMRAIVTSEHKKKCQLSLAPTDNRFCLPIGNGSFHCFVSLPSRDVFELTSFESRPTKTSRCVAQSL